MICLVQQTSDHQGCHRRTWKGRSVVSFICKTFWLFSSFPCLWLLSKQLEFKLFSCHSWREVRFCHTDFLQQYFTTVIKTSWCVYERKCYFVKSLAEFFPNTLTALEASSQSCGKSEKDVLSVPTSDSQDQQGLQHENSLVLQETFLMSLNGLPSGQTNGLTTFWMQPGWNVKYFFLWCREARMLPPTPQTRHMVRYHKW